jgi:hypothetical protein
MQSNSSPPLSTFESEYDKNALLPNAVTKTSTSEESSDPGSDRLKSNLTLPPEYVDIQDDIDTTLTEVTAKMA